MAKDAKLGMTVDVINNADAGLQEVEKSVDNAAKNMRKQGRETTKDWQGLGDLFTGLLPRGMQRSIRSFKSTQRAVGRLSKSFKLLKAAWAAVGIGAAIILIETLIANWDELRDAITGVTQAQKDYEQIQKAGNDAVRDATSELDVYRKVLDDTTADEIARKDALVKLAQATGLMEGVDIHNPDDIQEINRAYAEYLANLEAQKKLEEATQLIKEKKKLLDEDEAKNLSLLEHAAIYGESLYNPIGAFYSYREEQTQNQLQVEEELNLLIVEQERLQKEAAATQNEITIALKEQEEERKKQAEAEKKIQEAKRKAQQEAEANAKYLANLEKTLSEEIMLAQIDDEQKRLEKELELRHLEEMEKARSAGATAAQLLQIEKKYELDLAELQQTFEDEAQRKKEDEDKRMLENHKALQEELMLINMDEEAKELEMLRRKHEKRLQLAEGNMQLMLEAQTAFAEQSEAIEEKYRIQRKEKKEKEEDELLKIKSSAQKATVNATQNMFGTLEALAGENEKRQKDLAITGVLLSQAVAMANGIKVASEAAKDPWTLAAGIITAVTAVLGAFVGVKAILAEATDGGGAGGGTPRTPPTQALVPTGVARLDSPEEGSNQAFVVQSELEGANLQANNMYNQTSLNPG